MDAIHVDVIDWVILLSVQKEHAYLAALPQLNVEVVKLVILSIQTQIHVTQVNHFLHSFVYVKINFPGYFLNNKIWLILRTILYKNIIFSKSKL